MVHISYPHPFFPQALATVVSIAAAIIVYVAAIFLFGAVGEDDIMLLPKGAKLCGILKKMKLLRK